MEERLSDGRLGRASSVGPFGAAPEMELANCSWRSQVAKCAPT